MGDLPRLSRALVVQFFAVPRRCLRTTLPGASTPNFRGVDLQRPPQIFFVVTLRSLRTALPGASTPNFGRVDLQRPSRAVVVQFFLRAHAILAVDLQRLPRQFCTALPRATTPFVP